MTDALSVPASAVTSADAPAGPAAEEPASAETPQPGQSCHPAYTPCLPDLPGHAMDCGDLTAGQRPVTVNNVGVDPYRLDSDRDGVGCTS